MEYQKIKNLLDKTADQPLKFGTRTLVEVTDASNETCKTGKQIEYPDVEVKSMTSVVSI